MRIKMTRAVPILTLLIVGLAVLGHGLLEAQSAASGTAPAPEHAKPVKRLLIRNAMIIYGNAEPPFGPANVCIEDGRIARVGGMPREWQADAEIDATGKYVMPGIVNGHIHLQDERGGGIEWTIKEGIPYHVPTLMREVKDMVDKGRIERAKK